MPRTAMPSESDKNSKLPKPSEESVTSERLLSSAIAGAANVATTRVMNVKQLFIAASTDKASSEVQKE